VSAGHGRVATRAGAALAACLVLAGCAGIPQSSAPRIVEAVPSTGPTEEPDVRFQPRPPQTGQTREEVVQAFLDALGSAEHQHGVARQFLTAAAAAKWRDDAGATVLAHAPKVEQENGGAEVSISGIQVGSLDPRGSYTSVAPGGPLYRYRLQFAQVDGQWRIANPAPGVIMTASGLNQVYRRLNVYFLARNRSRVVPDPRWFAASRDALPNLLMKALLGGPSTSLADAVTTKLGDGVLLASNVVPESDRLRVFLSGLADRGAAAQAGASAQIVWTLSQLGDAPAVEVYDDGQPLTVDGVGAVQRIQNWRSYDPDSLPLDTSGYFIRRGAVWTTDGGPTPGPAGRGAYQALSVGVSTDLSRLAVVGRLRNGVALYVGPARGVLTRRLTASALADPTWDTATGRVWTVRNGTEIIQVPARGLPVQVMAPGLDRQQGIGAIRLARDGSRVALLVGSPGARVLYVGAVSSSGSGVTELRSIAPRLTNVIDVTWASADSLVVLTTKGAGEASMYSVGVDGSWSNMVTTAGLPALPTAVTAAPGHATLAIAEGGIWRMRDSHEGWTGVFPRRNGLAADSAAAYPG